jgi:hypothetical protein
MTIFCQCKDCRKANKRGLVIGSRLLKHLGTRAHHISQYVRHHKFQKGRGKLRVHSLTDY